MRCKLTPWKESPWFLRGVSINTHNTEPFINKMIILKILKHKNIRTFLSDPNIRHALFRPLLVTVCPHNCFDKVESFLPLDPRFAGSNPAEVDGF
jgi:hypothetical protein